MKYWFELRHTGFHCADAHHTQLVHDLVKELRYSCCLNVEAEAESANQATTATDPQAS